MFFSTEMFCNYFKSDVLSQYSSELFICFIAMIKTISPAIFSLVINNERNGMFEKSTIIY